MLAYDVKKRFYGQLTATYFFIYVVSAEFADRILPKMNLVCIVSVKHSLFII